MMLTRDGCIFFLPRRSAVRRWAFQALEVFTGIACVFGGATDEEYREMVLKVRERCRREYW